MVRALAINAISVTVLYICGVIGVITDVGGANLHTMPMLRFAVYGSLTVSMLSTFTAGVLAVGRAMRWLSRQDQP
jgi:hypothetical protein